MKKVILVVHQDPQAPRVQMGQLAKQELLVQLAQVDSQDLVELLDSVDSQGSVDSQDSAVILE